MNADHIEKLRDISDRANHAFGAASLLCTVFESGGGWEESKVEAGVQLLKGYLFTLANDLYQIVSPEPTAQPQPTPAKADKKRKAVKR